MAEDRIVLKEGQHLDARILGFKTKHGKPAKVDGAPVWSSTTSDVIEIDQDADGMSATIHAVGEGEAVLQITADADLGEGVKPLVAQRNIQVLPGDAVDVQLEFDAPVDDDDSPPAPPVTSKGKPDKKAKKKK